MTMKKIFGLVALCLSVVIAGCSSDGITVNPTFTEIPDTDPESKEPEPKEPEPKEPEPKEPEPKEPEPKEPEPKEPEPKEPEPKEPEPKEPEPKEPEPKEPETETETETETEMEMEMETEMEMEMEMEMEAEPEPMPSPPLIASDLFSELKNVVIDGRDLRFNIFPPARDIDDDNIFGYYRTKNNIQSTEFGIIPHSNVGVLLPQNIIDNSASATYFVIIEANVFDRTLPSNRPDFGQSFESLVFEVNLSRHTIETDGLNPEDMPSGLDFDGSYDQLTGEISGTASVTYRGQVVSGLEVTQGLIGTNGLVGIFSGVDAEKSLSIYGGFVGRRAR